MNGILDLINDARAYFGLSRRITTNILWLFVQRLSMMIFSMTIGIWSARYLTSEPYGDWAYVLALVGLFLVLSQLGTEKIVVRSLFKNPEQTAAILGSTFLMRIVGGTMGMAGVFAAVILLYPDNSELITMAFVVGPVLIFRAFEVVPNLSEAKVASRNVVLMRTVAQVTCSLVRLGLILGKAGVFWFACSTLLEGILAAIGFSIVVARAGYPLWRWRWNSSVARAILRDSWPLAFSALAVGIYLQVDQLMLGKLMGSHEVGIYAAAIKISLVWYFVPVAITNSFYPSILEAHGQSRERLEKKMARLFKLLVMLSYGVIALGTAVAWFVVPIAYGPDFKGAEVVLAIHLWGGLFVCLGVGTNPWTMAHNQVRFVMVSRIAAAVINVAANLLLIPWLGPPGAAVATVITLFVASIGSCAVYPPTRRLAWLMVRALALRG